MSDTDATLYEITDEMLEVFEELEESGGELTPDVEERLEQVSEDFEEKIERCIRMYRELESRAKATKAEEQRLKKLRKSRENQAERLKDYIHAQLQKVGRDKVETPIGKAYRVQNSRASVNVLVDVEDLPDSWVRVIPEKRKADKRKIEQLYREGEIPEGSVGNLVEITRGEHLRMG